MKELQIFKGPLLLLIVALKKDKYALPYNPNTLVPGLVVKIKENIP